MTVNTNVSDDVNEPSETVTVIVVVPDWFKAGLTVTVRLAPEPPNTIFASGTRALFDEEPVTTRLAAAVSTSPTVKPIAPVGVSSAVD